MISMSYQFGDIYTPLPTFKDFEGAFYNDKLEPYIRRRGTNEK